MEGCILLVDDSVPWRDLFRRLLSGSFEDDRKILSMFELSDETFAPSAEQLKQIQGASLAVVDLELGPRLKSKLADEFGRTRVLPRLRNIAPWLPVLLSSSHLRDKRNFSGRLFAAGFDAVVSKEHLPELSPERWRLLCHDAQVQRAASISGRSVETIRRLVETPVPLHASGDIAGAIDKWGREGVEVAASLLDLGGSEVFLESLVQGHSGLLVVKAYCMGSAGKVSWLLKFGSNLAKLFLEARNHRNMVRDGISRKMSVPLFRRRPVTWGGFGVIAYEFEEEDETAAEAWERHGEDAVLPKILDTLSQFYGSAASGYMVIPADFASGIFVRPLEGACGYDETGGLAGIVGGRRTEPIEVKVGRQHGDLHARNILMCSTGAVLIDFAHFVSAAERGVPLADVCKLMVDLTVFCETSWEFSDLLQPDCLRRGSALEFVHRAGVFLDEVPTAGESYFFRLTTACFLSRYLTYKNVSGTAKKLMVAALGSIEW